MRTRKDGRALQRPPVEDETPVGDSKPGLAVRIAHSRKHVGRTSMARRPRQDRSQSLQPLAVSGTMAPAQVGGGSIGLPDDVKLLVMLGIVLGVWAVLSKRTGLGVGMIVVALLVAGAVTVGQEVTQVLIPSQG